MNLTSDINHGFTGIEQITCSPQIGAKISLNSVKYCLTGNWLLPLHIILLRVLIYLSVLSNISCVIFALLVESKLATRTKYLKSLFQNQMV